MLAFKVNNLDVEIEKPVSDISTSSDNLRGVNHV